MDQDQDEVVVTVLVDLSGVPLADVPAPTRELIERLVRGGGEQVSAFSSSI